MVMVEVPSHREVLSLHCHLLGAPVWVELAWVVSVVMEDSLQQAVQFPPNHLLVVLPHHHYILHPQADPSVQNHPSAAPWAVPSLPAVHSQAVFARNHRVA